MSETNPYQAPQALAPSATNAPGGVRRLIGSVLGLLLGGLSFAQICAMVGYNIGLARFNLALPPVQYPVIGCLIGILLGAFVGCVAGWRIAGRQKIRWAAVAVGALVDTFATLASQYVSWELTAANAWPNILVGVVLGGSAAALADACFRRGKAA